MEQSDCVDTETTEKVAQNGTEYNSSFENNHLEHMEINEIKEVSTSTINIVDSNPIDSEPIEDKATECDDKTINTMNQTESIQQEQIEIKEKVFFKDKSLVELSRYAWGAKRPFYLNGCSWSPDGTCILTSVNEDGMHLIDLPMDLYKTESVTKDRPLDVLQSAVHVKNCGTVYDYCWYPFMNSRVPETCCWIATQQHGPIQMWDAFDGSLRCTYRGYDAVDEVEAAISVVFSADGSQVIGGYRKSIKIFRTNVPGRDFSNYPLKSAASCLAVSKVQPDLLAIGSWNTSIAIADLRSDNLDVLHKLNGHTGGVTFMKFLADSNCLLTGARKDNKLLYWDLRSVKQPVFYLCRDVETNQRIYFDVSTCGRWLASGDTNGFGRVWDLKRLQTDGKLTEMKFKLHNDCCNGVSFHPIWPIIATSSGQFHFTSDETIDVIKEKENSLILWWHGNK